MAVAVLSDDQSRFAAFAREDLRLWENWSQAPVPCRSKCCFARKQHTSLLFPSPSLRPCADSVGRWSISIFLDSNWLSTFGTVAACWCCLWRPPLAAHVCSRERLTAQAARSLKFDDGSLAGKCATLQEHLEAFGAGARARFSTIATPEELTVANASLLAEAGRVSLDITVMHPVLRAIYSSDRFFDRPVAELPMQAPSACRRVAGCRALAGKMLVLGTLDSLPPATTPTPAGRPAAAEPSGSSRRAPRCEGSFWIGGAGTSWRRLFRESLASCLPPISRVTRTTCAS